MKQFFLIFIGASFFCSCQNHDFDEVSNSSLNSQPRTTESPAYLVFSSKDDLANVISDMKNGDHFAATRATKAVSGQVPLVSDNIPFVSLLESNKQELMAKLSPAQLDSINNDEDELEFCVSDSVIADYEFAQLLNASREIQVNDTVYKYYGNGIAFTEHSHADQLKYIDDDVSKISVAENTIGKKLTIKGDVEFIPYAYAEVEEAEINNASTRAALDKESLILKNGVTISANDIKDVDYNSKGDGGWFHRTWNGIWGRNVLAINKFNGHKRLRLGFYDQNYIVYANIGATMKMQKKVCGIWWNCKADEIRVGWSAIELKYTFPSPVIKYLNPNVNPSKAVETDYPAWFNNNFPFRNENSVLFYIPFTSYNIKVKNVNSLLKSGIKTLINKGTKELKNYINTTPESQRGLYSVENSVLYVVTGTDEFRKTKAKTFDKKFYAKWFPGTYQIGFSYNGSFNVRSISMDGGKSTKLSSGTVYGAVKYKGKWLAARITKSKE